jgi:hypothetical protein
MFVNNCEFPTTTSIKVGIVRYQQLDLALHFTHQPLANGIRHPQLSVIFLVYIPLKNHIQEITKAIKLFNWKLGVF